MKVVDKSLIAIVVGVLLLVAVAFVAVLRRAPPTYEAENSAANVAHNYLFALQQRDYARAYGYLSPSLKGHPTSVEQFAEDIRNNGYSFSLTTDDSIALEIESSRPLGVPAGTEAVLVRETRFSTGGLFGNSQYSSTFEMQLQREDGAWKIVASEQYFLRCWTDKAGCK
ncbi:MAG: hypothetical protein KGJ80_04875 [Chloroflexota bacterium]|nr:hypothetical protein [Chloroflexota bacterium]